MQPSGSIISARDLGAIEQPTKSVPAARRDGKALLAGGGWPRLRAAVPGDTSGIGQARASGVVQPGLPTLFVPAGASPLRQPAHDIDPPHACSPAAKLCYDFTCNHVITYSALGIMAENHAVTALSLTVIGRKAAGWLDGGGGVRASPAGLELVIVTDTIGSHSSVQHPKLNSSVSVSPVAISLKRRTVSSTRVMADDNS
jgi:hypothetical protein